MPGHQRVIRWDIDTRNFMNKFIGMASGVKYSGEGTEFLLESRQHIDVPSNELPCFRYANCEVVSGKRFANHFKKGDKVIVLGLKANKAGDVIKLFSELKEQIDILKEKGYAGLFFDTQNSTLIKYASRSPGFAKIEPSMLQSANAKAKYAIGAIKHGFPKKYLRSKVWRVIVKF